jgi:hypothetical protein
MMQRCKLHDCLKAAALTLQLACSPVGRTDEPRSGSGAVSPAGDVCAPPGTAPSREGFFHEVLFPAVTARTPRFTDYTADSYHINKLDLVQGLPLHARACTVQLKAVLVLGPLGVLWTYHVVALVDDGTKVRVNALVMPHARITGKGWGLISNEKATELLRELENAPLVQPGVPVPPPEDMKSDSSYGMLLAVFDPEGPKYFHAENVEFSTDPGRQRLLDRINALLGATSNSAYAHGQ